MNMVSTKAATRLSGGMKLMAGAFVISALCFSSLALAQDRDRDGDRDHYHDRDRDRITTLVPGTVIPVRTNEAIDVRKGDYRVYTGIVDQDVRGDDGRLAIPRGSNVELMVRFARDNDMILDLDSVMVNGQRYAPATDTKRVQSQLDDSLVGGIVGAITGGQAQGQAVRVPRDAVVTFRLRRPLNMGVPDRGVMRDGRHYHDYENDRYRGNEPGR
jgi:hypothetical protein